jgi:hypothetical protein
MYRTVLFILKMSDFSARIGFVVHQIQYVLKRWEAGVYCNVRGEGGESKVAE